MSSLIFRRGRTACGVTMLIVGVALSAYFATKLASRPVEPSAVAVSPSLAPVENPAPLPAVAPVAQSTPTPPLLKAPATAAAHERAVAKFPQLAIAGSPLNTSFLAKVRAYQDRNSSIFEDTEWPAQVAAECFQELQQRIFTAAAPPEPNFRFLASSPRYAAVRNSATVRSSDSPRSYASSYGSGRFYGGTFSGGSVSPTYNVYVNSVSTANSCQTTAPARTMGIQRRARSASVKGF